MWLSNCLLCHNLIYWMHSLILVFIAGEWPGHFSISSLSYECKSLLPALEFNFASCPKCFITPSYLSISKTPRLWGIWEQSLDFYSVSVLVTLSHPPYEQYHQVFFSWSMLAFLLEHTWKSGIKDGSGTMSEPLSWAVPFHGYGWRPLIRSSAGAGYSVRRPALSGITPRVRWCKVSSRESQTFPVTNSARDTAAQFLLRATGCESEYHLLKLPTELMGFGWWGI